MSLGQAAAAATGVVVALEAVGAAVAERVAEAVGATDVVAALVAFALVGALALVAFVLVGALVWSPWGETIGPAGQASTSSTSTSSNGDKYTVKRGEGSGFAGMVVQLGRPPVWGRSDCCAET